MTTDRRLGRVATGAQAIALAIVTAVLVWRPVTNWCHVIGLINAAESGSVASVRAELANGVDVNGRGTEGESAIQMAAWHGHLDIVRILLDHCAKPDRALSAAVATNRPEIVELLVARGANPNPPDTSPGYSPLADALAHGNRRIVAILKRAGARAY